MKKNKKITNKSTPLSCKKKKSSEYKVSQSSSSLTKGTYIDSGTSESANIVPETNWLIIIKNTQKPNNAGNS